MFRCSTRSSEKTITSDIRQENGKENENYPKERTEVVEEIMLKNDENHLEDTGFPALTDQTRSIQEKVLEKSQMRGNQEQTWTTDI